MIEQFSNLSKEEENLVMNVPALIALLVAGTDKDIDQKEIDRALELMKWRKFHARPDLMDYYKEVSKNFHADVGRLVDELKPKEVEERRNILSDELKRLNGIFPKFDKEFAEQLYKSYRELAKGVAEASGGFLGYLSVNFEESKLIKLPMIDDPRTYNV